MADVLDPKLVARIQKLHAMAESAREVGSLAEADSFMSAVTATLNKYNLDMSVLSLDLRDAADPLGMSSEWGATKRHKRKPVAWAQNLAIHVARAHNCAALVSTTSSAVFFYGRASNRGVAVKMFLYLRDMAERLNWAEYATEVRRRRKEHGSERGGGQWRLNWLEGFVAEIANRYQAMRARADADKGMSLVLTSVRKEAETEANQHITPAEKMKIHKMAAAALYDAVVRGLGAEAARTVNLKPDALDSPATPRTRHLTA